MTMPMWRMPRPNRKRGRVGLPLGLDRREKVVDRLFLPPLTAEQLLAKLVEAENVGGRMQPAKVDEFGDRLLAQPLDVECAARHEMPEALEPLRGADQAAGAADVDLALLGDGFAVAFRAVVGEDVGVADLVAGEVFHDLRDDVAGALDSHAVADAQAEPLDLVAIVKRDVGDDHAAYAHRCQPTDGRQLARAPDLDVDRFQRRLRLLRREFVGEAPAWRARDEAETFLQVQPVDLVDHAVDVERQIGAGLLDRAIVRQHGGEVVAADE